MMTLSMRVLGAVALWCSITSLGQASMVFNKTYTNSHGSPSVELATVDSILGSSLTYLDKWEYDFGKWVEDGDLDLD